MIDFLDLSDDMYNGVDDERAQRELSWLHDSANDINKRPDSISIDLTHSVLGELKDETNRISVDRQILIDMSDSQDDVTFVAKNSSNGSPHRKIPPSNSVRKVFMSSPEGSEEVMILSSSASGHRNGDLSMAASDRIEPPIPRRPHPPHPSLTPSFARSQSSNTPQIITPSSSSSSSSSSPSSSSSSSSSRTAEVEVMGIPRAVPETAVLPECSISRTRLLLQQRTDIDDETCRLMLFLANEEDEERAKRAADLINKRYECMICLDNECRIEDMITLSCQPIGHRFCNECFSGYCANKIGEALVTSNDLVCPAEKCKHPIDINELKAHVSEEVFEKFDRFMLKNYCQENSYRTCPHCNEWFADIPQDDGEEQQWKSVQCGLTTCGKTFCGKCGQPPHKGQSDQDISCEEYAKWLQENSTSDQSLAAYLSTAAVQRCPSCKEVAESGGGCKFMYCRCKAKFCFICGIALAEKDHYAHFKGPGCNGPFGLTCRGMKTSDVSGIANAAPDKSAVYARIQAVEIANMQAQMLHAKNARGRKRPR